VSFQNDFEIDIELELEFNLLCYIN
jgi:hypothetical protein